MSYELGVMSYDILAVREFYFQDSFILITLLTGLEV